MNKHWEPHVGASDDWLTPKYIFDAMEVVFDLDVAAPIGGSYAPCLNSISTNGLTHEWHGFVWMNPPFGRRNAIESWLTKFIAHGDGVALTPDRTSAPWFQKSAWRMDEILFLSPKVKFERTDGSVGKAPTNGTALMAIGDRGAGALKQARRLGFLARPERAQAGVCGAGSEV